MEDKIFNITVDELRSLSPATPDLYGDDAVNAVSDVLRTKSCIGDFSPCTVNVLPSMYQMISDVDEMKWFFDHVIQKPQVNESYSAVFVSRHKKLTKEEQERTGMTRRESEFLNVQTFRLAGFKDESARDQESEWTFERFLKRVRRFNVDKYAYTNALGEPLPEKTLAVIFYVNPCDDIKVVNSFVEEYNKLNDGILKAHLSGKPVSADLHSYQWYGKADDTIKHFKAKCKGSRYWLDFDVDVPTWFKANEYHYDFPDGSKGGYFTVFKNILNSTFGKGNYVIVDTSGGYHVLVRTSSIKSNPHNFCKEVRAIYDEALELGEEPYVDEKGNCKFECIINDSQIPGLPLPGTYQYGRPVTVLNKEDFD